MPANQNPRDMLRLYGSRWSPNAKRVALVLLEKQVKFEAVEVDMINREHKNVSYVAKQPFAEVPYIDDEGLVIYESRAICRYICRKYPNQGTPLVPAEDDLRAYALFEQAASVEIYNFDVHVQAAAYESVVKPALGMKTNKANYERHLKTLGQKLDIYDSILARQRFITGNEISLVDLFHIPYAVELEDAGSLFGYTYIGLVCTQRALCNFTNLNGCGKRIADKSGVVWWLGIRRS